MKAETEGERKRQKRVGSAVKKQHLSYLNGWVRLKIKIKQYICMH